MDDIIIQASGWIGTLLIILAYLLVSYKKIDSAKRPYQLMNLFGAIGVGVNVYFHQAWPALVMEIVWALIAISALINILKNKKG